MEFEKLEKQLLATAKAFRAFKTEFGYGKSGEELLKPFFRSLEESNKSSESDKTQSRRDEQTLVAAALCFVRHNFKKFVRNY